MRPGLHALKSAIRAASITLFLAVVLLLSLHALPQALPHALGAKTIESDALSAGLATSQKSDDDSDKKKDDDEGKKKDDDVIDAEFEVKDS